MNKFSDTIKKTKPTNYRYRRRNLDESHRKYFQQSYRRKFPKSNEKRCLSRYKKHTK